MIKFDSSVCDVWINEGPFVLAFGDSARCWPYFWWKRTESCPEAQISTMSTLPLQHNAKGHKHAAGKAWETLYQQVEIWPLVIMKSSTVTCCLYVVSPAIHLTESSLFVCSMRMKDNICLMDLLYGFNRECKGKVSTVLKKQLFMFYCVVEAGGWIKY